MPHDTATTWQHYASVCQGSAGDAMRPAQAFQPPRIVAQRRIVDGRAVLEFCDGSMITPAEAVRHGWQIEPLAAGIAQQSLQRVTL